MKEQNRRSLNRKAALALAAILVTSAMMGIPAYAETEASIDALPVQVSETADYAEEPVAEEVDEPVAEEGEEPVAEETDAPAAEDVEEPAAEEVAAEVTEAASNNDISLTAITVDISGGEFNGAINYATSISGGTFNGDVYNVETSISGGTFNGKVYDIPEITGGEFNGEVYDVNLISDGTFNEKVSDVATIDGGEFSGEVSGVATINNGEFYGKVSNPATVAGGTFYVAPDPDDTGWQALVNSWKELGVPSKVQFSEDAAESEIFADLDLTDNIAGDAKYEKFEVALKKDKTATWDKVSQAEEYEVALYKVIPAETEDEEAKEEIIYKTVTAETTFDFSDKVKTTATYKVSVTVRANGIWSESDKVFSDTEILTAKPVLTPDTKNYVKGGEGFNVRIALNGNTLESIELVSGGPLSEDDDYSIDENGVVTIADHVFADGFINDEDYFGDEDGTEDEFDEEAVTLALDENGNEVKTLKFIFSDGDDKNADYENEDLVVSMDVTVLEATGDVTFILAERKADSYASDDTTANDGTEEGLIVIKSNTEVPLTYFTAAEFKLKNEAEDGSKIEYEIVPEEGFAILYHEETETYEINVKPENGTAPAVSENEADGGIVIGRIKYPGGYGKGTITAYDIRITKEMPDNLYKTYEDVDAWNFDYEVKEPTRTLTVNVDFNLPTDTKNEADYQKMTLNVYSPKIGNYTVILDSGYELEKLMNAAKGTFGVSAFKVEDNKYTVELSNLPANDTYTVSIKGDGYRTAKTNVSLNENKSVYFWNNAKDAAEIQIMTEAGAMEKKVDKNFLAGDIIMDGKIDLYDLSAVSSYFGKGMGSDENNMKNDVIANEGYIQYDLNRDGVVDIIDITMVIDGWSK